MERLNFKTTYLEQFSPELDFTSCPPVSRHYVICSTPRSGSHMLYQTGCLGFPLEYLNERNLYHWQRRFGTCNAFDSLEQIKRIRTSPNGCFGCKLHFYQFQQFCRRKQLNDCFPGAKYILLTGRDLLGQAISYARAAHTGSWLSSIPSIRPPSYNRRHIEHSLCYLARHNACWSYLIARRQLECLHLTYEEILVDGNSSIKRIADFLDIDLSDGALTTRESLTKPQGDSTNQEWRERFIHETNGTGYAKELRYLYEYDNLPHIKFTSLVTRLAKRMVRAVSDTANKR